MNEEKLLRLGLKDGHIVHIDEVKRGVGCNCICPNCKSTLIAKKGNIKTHHFAHKSELECNGAVETAIHLLAKEILSQEKTIYLPSFQKYISSLQKEVVILNYNRPFTFQEVTLEERIKINSTFIIADAVCIVKEKQLIVEFANTHFSDSDKIEKLISGDLPCIEVDISTADQNRNDLSEKLKTNYFPIKWISNPRGELKADKIKEEEECKQKKRREELKEQRRLKEERRKKIKLYKAELKRKDEENKKYREQERLKKIEKDIENNKKRMVQEQIRQQRAITEALKRGKVVKKCPIKNLIISEFIKSCNSAYPVITHLHSGGKMNGKIYDRRPDFVDMFVDQKRYILIPPNFSTLEEKEKKYYTNYHAAAEIYLKLIRLVQTCKFPCRICKMFEGILDSESMICSYEDGLSISDKLFFDLE